MPNRDDVVRVLDKMLAEGWRISGTKGHGGPDWQHITVEMRRPVPADVTGLDKQSWERLRALGLDASALQPYEEAIGIRDDIASAAARAIADHTHREVIGGESP